MADTIESEIKKQLTTISPYSEKSLRLIINTNFELFKKIIKSNPNIFKIFEHLHELLEELIIENRVDVFDVLIENNANLNFKMNCRGYGLKKYVIFVTVINNNLAITELLLKNNIDPNTTESNTLLHIAIQNLNCDMIDLLLQYKADVNKCNDRGEFPLYFACYYNNLDIVKLILDQKPSINLQAVHGSSALHAAVAGQNIETSQLLIDHKINVNLTDTNNMTAYDWSVLRKNKGIQKLLIKNGAIVKSNCVIL